MKTSFISLVFLLFSHFTFAQFGNDCGVPVWDANRNYSFTPSPSVVLYSGTIYQNTGYVNANSTAPDVNSAWTSLGACTISIAPIASETDCTSATA